jgi:predicted alpha/beta superfamily hydrolase
MRKILTQILILISMISFGQDLSKQKEEIAKTGELSLKYEIKHLTSKYYPNEERILKVFLPENYDPSKKHPVIYTLDGETIFDLSIKNISVLQNNTLDGNNIIPECITVAINNIDRGRDLTPNLGFNTNLPLGKFKKGSEIFYNILNQEIVPFITENYSTSGFNVLIGHSNAGHFATQLYLKEDNNFKGIIALSVNDTGNYFQKQLTKNLNQDKSKFLFLGYGNKDNGFNELGKNLEKQKLPNKNIFVKAYNADHIQLPFTSLFDAIKFMFSDYRFYDDLIEQNYNDKFDYSLFLNKYKNNISDKYGIKTEIDYDIMYLIEKAIEMNKEFVFNNLLNEIDRTELLQLQYRFWYSNELNQKERAKNYLHQMLQSEDETDKKIFFANLKSQYFDFYINKLNQPSEFIDFVEKAKKKWTEYTLEFNYLILKTLVDEKIKSSKKKKYYKYCEKNFKENRYFTMEDLQKLNKKTDASRVDD